MSPLELARKAQSDLEATGQMLAKKMNACWNPETRRYEGEHEFIHDLINAQLKTWFSLRSLIRALEGK